MKILSLNFAIALSQSRPIQTPPSLQVDSYMWEVMWPVCMCAYAHVMFRDHLEETVLARMHAYLL
jgi:hypothetical protein